MKEKPKNCTHPDCFSCPYADCIWDGDDKFYRYNHSDKGKIRTERYDSSDKGREKAQRHRQRQIKSGKNAEYCRRYYRRRKNLDKVYLAIITYIQEHGYAPTIRELCELTGFKSTSTVKRFLDKLIELGKIETDAGIGFSRAIRVTGYKFVKINQERSQPCVEGDAGVQKK